VTFQADETNVEPVAAETVQMARREVLGRLNQPRAESPLHSSAQAEVMEELVAQLRRTAQGIENSSALLIGPAGVGKFRLLRGALARFGASGENQARAECGSAGVGKTPGGGRASGGEGGAQDLSESEFISVHLHPLLIPDDKTALIALAEQLQVSSAVELSRCVSFCDGVRYILHLLRRAKPAKQLEARRESQAQPVCIVLHEFERFAQRPKQTLLYSLYDLLQTAEAQLAVIGLTALCDAPDLLEKRVRSRFSGRMLVVPPLNSVSDVSMLIDSALALPPSMPSRYASLWAHHVRILLKKLDQCKPLRLRLQLGMSQRDVLMAVRLLIAELGPACPLPSVGAFGRSVEQLSLQSIEQTVRELSNTETLLLLCLKKILDKEIAPPHTFAIVLREYASFVSEYEGAGGVYDLPRAMLTKSFEHLSALGLVAVSTVGKSSHWLPLLEGSSLRLLVGSSTLHSIVRANLRLPDSVRRFGSSWLQ